MTNKEEMESPIENKEIDPERAIEHVKKNRQKAKEFADKVRNGYIPEKRLKDEIVEKLYETLTSSHDKPSYDDLLELRNYLLSDRKTDSGQGQIQDKGDNESNSKNTKPEKSEAVLIDDSVRDKSKSKKQTDADSEPEEIEGKDYFVHEFKEPLGSIRFNKDLTCTDSHGNVIGLWNEDGKIHDPSGKQIGHLPSQVTDEFNAFLEALGLNTGKASAWHWKFRFHF